MKPDRFLLLNRKETLIALMFGVIAGVIASMAERADAIITGGNATPLGFVNTYTWILISAALFGPIGAIITTEAQAAIGLITFANPLSWLWPPINFVFAVVVGFVSIYALRLKPGVGLRSRIILMSITCAILDVPLTYLVIVIVLKLPFIFYLAVLPIYLLLQLIN